MNKHYYMDNNCVTDTNSQKNNKKNDNEEIDNELDIQDHNICGNEDDINVDDDKYVLWIGSDE